MSIIFVIKLKPFTHSNNIYHIDYIYDKIQNTFYSNDNIIYNSDIVGRLIDLNKHYIILNDENRTHNTFYQTLGIDGEITISNDVYYFIENGSNTNNKYVQQIHHKHYILVINIKDYDILHTIPAESIVDINTYNSNIDTDVENIKLIPFQFINPYNNELQDIIDTILYSEYTIQYNTTKPVKFKTNMTISLFSLFSYEHVSEQTWNINDIQIDIKFNNQIDSYSIYNDSSGLYIINSTTDTCMNILDNDIIIQKNSSINIYNKKEYNNDDTIRYFHIRLFNSVFFNLYKGVRIHYILQLNPIGNEEYKIEKILDTQNNTERDLNHLNKYTGRLDDHNLNYIVLNDEFLQRSILFEFLGINGSIQIQNGVYIFKDTSFDEYHALKPPSFSENTSRSEDVFFNFATTIQYPYYIAIIPQTYHDDLTNKVYISRKNTDNIKNNLSIYCNKYIQHFIYNQYLLYRNKRIFFEVSSPLEFRRIFSLSSFTGLIKNDLFIYFNDFKFTVFIENDNIILQDVNDPNYQDILFHYIDMSFSVDTNTVICIENNSALIKKEVLHIFLHKNVILSEENHNKYILRLGDVQIGYWRDSSDQFFTSYNDFFNKSNPLDLVSIFPYTSEMNNMNTKPNFIGGYKIIECYDVLNNQVYEENDISDILLQLGTGISILEGSLESYNFNFFTFLFHRENTSYTSNNIFENKIQGKGYIYNLSGDFYLCDYNIPVASDTSYITFQEIQPQKFVMLNKTNSFIHGKSLFYDGDYFTTYRSDLSSTSLTQIPLTLTQFPFIKFYMDKYIQFAYKEYIIKPNENIVLRSNALIKRKFLFYDIYGSIWGSPFSDGTFSATSDLNIEYEGNIYKKSFGGFTYFPSMLNSEREDLIKNIDTRDFSENTQIVIMNSNDNNDVIFYVHRAFEVVPQRIRSFIRLGERDTSSYSSLSIDKWQIIDEYNVLTDTIYNNDNSMTLLLGDFSENNIKILTSSFQNSDISINSNSDYSSLDDSTIYETSNNEFWISINENLVSDYFDIWPNMRDYGCIIVDKYFSFKKNKESNYTNNEHHSIQLQTKLQQYLRFFFIEYSLIPGTRIKLKNTLVDFNFLSVLKTGRIFTPSYNTSDLTYFNIKHITNNDPINPVSNDYYYYNERDSLYFVKETSPGSGWYSRLRYTTFNKDTFIYVDLSENAPETLFIYAYYRLDVELLNIKYIFTLDYTTHDTLINHGHRIHSFMDAETGEFVTESSMNDYVGLFEDKQYIYFHVPYTYIPQSSNNITLPQLFKNRMQGLSGGEIIRIDHPEQNIFDYYDYDNNINYFTIIPAYTEYKFQDSNFQHPNNHPDYNTYDNIWDISLDTLYPDSSYILSLRPHHTDLSDSYVVAVYHLYSNIQGLTNFNGGTFTTPSIQTIYDSLNDDIDSFFYRRKFVRYKLGPTSRIILKTNNDISLSNIFSNQNLDSFPSSQDDILIYIDIAGYILELRNNRFVEPYTNTNLLDLSMQTLKQNSQIIIDNRNSESEYYLDIIRTFVDENRIIHSDIFTDVSLGHEFIDISTNTSFEYTDMSENKTYEYTIHEKDNMYIRIEFTHAFGYKIRSINNTKLVRNIETNTGSPYNSLVISASSIIIYFEFFRSNQIHFNISYISLQDVITNIETIQPTPSLTNFPDKYHLVVFCDIECSNINISNMSDNIIAEVQFNRCNIRSIDATNKNLRKLGIINSTITFSSLPSMYAPKLITNYENSTETKINYYCDIYIESTAQYGLTSYQYRINNMINPTIKVVNGIPITFRLHFENYNDSSFFRVFYGNNHNLNSHHNTGNMRIFGGPTDIVVNSKSELNKAWTAWNGFKEEDEYNNYINYEYTFLYDSSNNSNNFYYYGSENIQGAGGFYNNIEVITYEEFKTLDKSERITNTIPTRSLQFKSLPIYRSMPSDNVIEVISRQQTYSIEELYHDENNNQIFRTKTITKNVLQIENKLHPELVVLPDKEYIFKIIPLNIIESSNGTLTYEPFEYNFSILMCSVRNQTITNFETIQYINIVNVDENYQQYRSSIKYMKIKFLKTDINGNNIRYVYGTPRYTNSDESDFNDIQHYRNIRINDSSEDIVDYRLNMYFHHHKSLYNTFIEEDVQKNNTLYFGGPYRTNNYIYNMEEFYVNINNPLPIDFTPNFTYIYYIFINKENGEDKIIESNISLFSSRYINQEIFIDHTKLRHPLQYYMEYFQFLQIKDDTISFVFPNGYNPLHYLRHTLNQPIYLFSMRFSYSTFELTKPFYFRFVTSPNVVQEVRNIPFLREQYMTYIHSNEYDQFLNTIYNEKTSLIEYKKSLDIVKVYHLHRNITLNSNYLETYNNNLYRILSIHNINYLYNPNRTNDTLLNFNYFLELQSYKTDPFNIFVDDIYYLGPFNIILNNITYRNVVIILEKRFQILDNMNNNVEISFNTFFDLRKANRKIDTFDISYHYVYTIKSVYKIFRIEYDQNTSEYIFYERGTDALENKLGSNININVYENEFYIFDQSHLSNKHISESIYKNNIMRNSISFFPIDKINNTPVKKYYQYDSLNLQDAYEERRIFYISSTRSTHTNMKRDSFYYGSFLESEDVDFGNAEGKAYWKRESRSYNGSTNTINVLSEINNSSTIIENNVPVINNTFNFKILKNMREY